MSLLVRPIFILAMLVIGFARAQDTPSQPAAAEEPTKAQLQRVQEFLQSPQANQRQAAYKGCRARGDDFKSTYFQMLERAYGYHGTQVARVIQGAVGPSSPQGEAVANWQEWEKLAKPAAEFVLTDHDKDKTKHDEMDRQFADAQKAWLRVVGAKRTPGNSGADAQAKIEGSLAALREIHREKAYCRPDEFDADDELDLSDFEEDLSLGSDGTNHLRTLAAMSETFKALEDAHAHNDAQKWASPVHKTFARILNDRRAALGLQPLRLEEKLSDACAGHSKEMTAMGYFDHDSPVEKNKTFGMRAQNAGFQGSAGGECIFTGSPDAAAAEQAWWYSDGHRLINYSRGSNTLGLGPVGSMWTLNVGDYPW
ncbi:MAG: CAP domain-containing protein [Verrucomicrobiales bacterium]